jgi:dihydroflavonol-4-reductase
LRDVRQSLQRGDAHPVNLIVGGTGFIGGHLAEYFFKEGEICKGTFRKGSFLRIMDQCGIQCLEADPLDRGSLHEAMEMVNVVYNLACPTPDHGADERDRDYLTMNSKGLLNLLEEADEHGVKDFVHLSTLDVYGFDRKEIPSEAAEEEAPTASSAATPVTLPSHPYQAAKLQGERLVLDYGRKSEMDGGEMRVKIVRAAKAVGPRDSTLVLPILMMMKRGRRERMVLPSGSGSPMSFTHPKDVAQALFKVATFGEGGRIYQVKSFDCSVEELAAQVAEASGTQCQIKQEGLFNKTTIPPYTASQVRAGMRLGKQDSWGRIGYSPEYDVVRTAREIAEWHVKEPWLTEDEPT